MIRMERLRRLGHGRADLRIQISVASPLIAMHTRRTGRGVTTDPGHIRGGAEWADGWGQAADC
jgi:hypothetical protein